MFTGIIIYLGRIKKMKDSFYTVAASHSFLKKLKKGTSVAVNGVCLTVIEKPASNSFRLEIMPETEKRTNFRQLKINDLVNLELPITGNNFFSGHFVQGHIDGTAVIKEIKRKGNSRILKIGIPKKLNKYLVKKGSVALDGISLTIIDAGRDFFTVGITPYTWQKTNLSQSKIGNRVNIEVDILAKYLKKLLRKNYLK